MLFDYGQNKYKTWISINTTMISNKPIVVFTQNPSLLWLSTTHHHRGLPNQAPHSPNHYLALCTSPHPPRIITLIRSNQCRLSWSDGSSWDRCILDLAFDESLLTAQFLVPATPLIVMNSEIPILIWMNVPFLTRKQRWCWWWWWLWWRWSPW